MKSILGALVASVVWLAAIVPAAAEFVSPEIGVRFPDALGTLRHQGAAQRYGQPGLGYSLRYSSPDIRIDIYVYNADLRGIGTGVASQQVTQHFGQAEREMQAFYQQQRQTAQRVGGGPETIGAPPGQTPWLVARYDVQQGGRAMRSVVMLTGYRDYFIKVRATFPADGKGGADPLAPFAAELSALLASSLQTQAPSTPGNPPAPAK